MKIDRMVEGNLYKMKKHVHIYPTAKTGPNNEYKVLWGFKERQIPDTSKDIPPFVYLGYRMENWTYLDQHTSKIHYAMWDGDIWVMDNQFAKYIEPVWNEPENG